MLTSFCGILTLQVGTAILASVFFTIAALVLTENAFNYENDPNNAWPIPLVLAIIFVILVTLAGLVMFLAAYNESRGQCIAAVIILALAMAYWIILSCFSFANNASHIRKVCVVDRCPESFWLMDLQYRGNWRGAGNQIKPTTTSDDRPYHTEPNVYTHDGPDIKINMTTPTPKTTIQSPSEDKRKRDIDSNVHSKYIQTRQIHHNLKSNLLLNSNKNVFNQLYNNLQHTQEHIISKRNDNEKNTGDKGEDDSDENKDDTDEGVFNPDGETKYDFGLSMIGAIVMFVLNFVFFLFSILIMWSFAQELKWSEYYDEEEDERRQ